MVCGDTAAPCVAVVGRRSKTVICGKPAFASFVDEYDADRRAWPLCIRHLCAALRSCYRLGPVDQSKS